MRLFAKKLKQLRQENGWTQEQASKIIGIALSTLRSYEQGGTPDLGPLKKIVEKYAIPYDYLLNDTIPVIYDKDPFIDALKHILSYYTSQNEMAAAIGVSSAYLTKIFKGKIKEVTPKQLRKIADNSKGYITYIELMEICGYITNKDIFEYPYDKE